MATKKRKVITGISIFLAVIVLIVVTFPYLRVAFLYTVYFVQQTFITNPETAYRKYNSEYTVEEHIERLDDGLQYYLQYSDNFINSHERASHKWITNVEILYSIGYEFPEYFIIEFKVPEGTLNTYGEPYSYSECYLLGTIKKDKYYKIWVDDTSSPYKDLPSGEKKYYSYDPDGITYCAYKENDKYVFLHNDELNKNYPTEKSINVLGNTIDTVVWRRRVAEPLFELEISAESLGEREFNSNYTAEENLQRLTNLVKTNPNKINTAETYEEKDIIDVQIMYSLYYERPEYFLIQFKKERVDEEGVYDFQFIVGQIKNDEFYKIYVSPLDNDLGISPYFNNEDAHGTKKYYMPIDEDNKIGAFYYLNKNTSFFTIAYWNKSNNKIYEIEKNIDYVIKLDKYEWVPLMVAQN